MTIYFSKDKQLFARIHRDELIAALQDDRLPESFWIEMTDLRPGLAIVSDDEGCWYLGHIDLADSELHLNATPGENDGRNPHADLTVREYSMNTVVES